MTRSACNTDLRRAGNRSWRETRSHRAVIGSRVSADRVFPRALLYAMPMASLLWLVGAIIAHHYL